MTDQSNSIAYVRTEEAPKLPAPPSTVGIQGWLRKNLFSSPLYTVLTIVLGAILLWYIWDTLYWALVTAVWTGSNREACLGENVGACWPLVWDKFPQWIYGFYPIDERWRVNVVFIVAVLAMVPMLMPSMPFKKLNALFLILAFPLMTLILLTGGNFDFDRSSYLGVVALLLLGALVVPLMVYGLEQGIQRNKLALILGAGTVILWILSLFTGVALLPMAAALLAAGAAVFSIITGLGETSGTGRSAVTLWAIAAACVLVAMWLLDLDFGLVEVETSKWGGLLVTLVVSVTGIVASLPLGVVLALGRRSEMPVVKLFSVIFIELWRGVPLITVLFFSSVMLPLFLPEGTNFDKLLRALIGVALFSAAYMAEVVRSGLQAIPKGQYEGAMALGLSYWQMTNKIILPQALKISIPNIVGNFISLFKDTTLVSIIGLYDLLGIVRAGLKDSNWAAPSTTPTGYFTLALMFWIFCFAMSRYSIYTERRLNTGHKR
ncbi:MAG: amino acid ABC transporter permease [Alphaproteobacteria bacterium]|nr:amino acid ABC transporter permease [Alphaproteobacteria bacterium]